MNYTNENKKKVTAFLNDSGFQNLVVKDVGPLVAPVKVLWESDEIYFYGSNGAKKITISDVLSAVNGTMLS